MIKEPFRSVYGKMEYYFAKRWLDKNFGEQEYWGDYLSEKLPKKGNNVAQATFGD